VPARGGARMKERRFNVLRDIAIHGPTTTWAVSLSIDLPDDFAERKIAAEIGALRRWGAVRLVESRVSGGRVERTWTIADPPSPIAYRRASERGAPSVGDLVLAYDDWPRPVLSLIDRIDDDRFFPRPVFDGYPWRHAAWRVVPITRSVKAAS
jgi:hypothetical protein